MGRRRGLALVGLCAVAGCFAPRYERCAVRCVPQTGCPVGLTCDSDGYCRVPDDRRACSLDTDGGGGEAEWAWDAADASGWTISNRTLAMTCADLCGCPGGTVCCADNTSVGVATGGVVFDSGPQVSGGMNHQHDGFVAKRLAVPLAAGNHRLTIRVADLAASISGTAGSEPNVLPNWSIAVFDGAKSLGSFSDSWATSQCKVCPPEAADLGDKPLLFTTQPGTTAVDLVLSASHHSSQCASEVFGVQVKVASIQITKEP